LLHKEPRTSALSEDIALSTGDLIEGYRLTFLLVGGLADLGV
jgi:hypothetical protein